MDEIAIIDFGSQYTHLIARRIREFSCLANLYRDDIKFSELPKNVKGIIISGGPHSVADSKSPRVDKKILESGLPILGLCYGHQSLAFLLGGKVKKSDSREYGPASLRISRPSRLFKNIRKNSTVWMSHADSVTKLPEGFAAIGATGDCQVAAMAFEEKNLFGLQFHPEVEHTEFGSQILKNFVLDICQAKPEWKIENLASDLVRRIKKQCQNKNVFILVSGGVDSTVAFSLLTKALGKKRVLGCYIDTGFMRFKESEEIMKAYKKQGFDNLQKFDASEIFFRRLKGITEPEEKRKIIGQTFLDVKSLVSEHLKLDDKNWLLGQGTIYPDTIESGGTKHADKIKTHHNRVDAIQKLLSEGKLVEPLVDFYKDEVRAIGQLLKISPVLLNRHPFPGPGLAIRCLCQDGQKQKIREQAKIKKFLDQKFPDFQHAILPVRSVGVQGDNRSYAHPLAVWGRKDWDSLDKLSHTLTNRFAGLNRTVLLLNPPKNGTPVFRQCAGLIDLDPKRIALLQKIDHLVMDMVKKEKIYDSIWQFPIILLPVTDENGHESIVLRPFVSRDVMTLKFARISQRIIKSLVRKIIASGEISHIFYDVTNKPPGTVEWE